MHIYMLQNELTMAYTLQHMGTNDLPERDNFKENTLCSYIMNRMTTDSDGRGVLKVKLSSQCSCFFYSQKYCVSHRIDKTTLNLTPPPIL